MQTSKDVDYRDILYIISNSLDTIALMLESLNETIKEISK